MPVKRKGSTLDYGFNWTNWLKGRSIQSSIWSAPGLSVAQDTNDSTKTAVRLAGGEPGSTYFAKNTIVTTDGLEDYRVLIVDVID
ncbi:hypothetical protein DV711_06150 [Motiliproteus coralliicola]|uniref:Uncharacterized protein n=1 Tax=Motiliproteus coralliicola TaxID=2283196 RepID=A0A369WX78_9GAMM|nr:hypothetical protein DV711_06150 [Motiliproteus coralliicola]